MPNSHAHARTHTSSPMALYRRKISFMKSTLSSSLPCGPNAFSNKQNSSSSEIVGWTILRYFLNSFALTFVIDMALVIWNWQRVPWLLRHLCLMRNGTHIVVWRSFLDSWISINGACGERFQTTACVCLAQSCIRMVSWLLHSVLGRVSPARYGVLWQCTLAHGLCDDYFVICLALKMSVSFRIMIGPRVCTVDHFENKF